METKFFCPRATSKVIVAEAQGLTEEIPDSCRETSMKEPPSGALLDRKWGIACLVEPQSAVRNQEQAQNGAVKGQEEMS